MGEIEVEGPTARDLLQGLLSNDVDKLEPGDAQYTLLTNEAGGIIDDLILYRLDEHRYLIVANASNSDAVVRWLKEHELRGSDVRDVSDDYALLAVQGPNALAKLGLEPAKAFTWAMGEIDGVEVMINRTGYTGEEGVELACMADDAGELWDAIIARGVTPVRPRCARHAPPRGLLPAARQRHRPAVGRCLVRTRLGVRARHGVHRRRAAARDQGARAGAEARPVRDDREGDPAPRDDDRRRWRGHVGHAVADARRRDRHGLRARRREPPGTELVIDVRGKPRRAEVAKKPLYKKASA